MNKMTPKTLILDLDGVLITTPPWKADEIDLDGYSKFNSACVANLNELLSHQDFTIWLSSTRRTVKTLDEFNSIFRRRNIRTAITGFLPEYADCKSRKEEILRFVNESRISDFLVIDDDKSLNAIHNNLNSSLVLTDLTTGFNDEKLKEALMKITSKPIE